MRGIIVIALIGIGIAAMIRHSLLSRLSASQQAIERFSQVPDWSPLHWPRFAIPNLHESIGPISESPDAYSSAAHSRYV